MKNYQEMKTIADNLVQVEESGWNSDIDMAYPTFKVGEFQVEPRIHCEPEDAIWPRDLGNIFDDGFKLGLHAMYAAFKSLEQSAPINNNAPVEASISAKVGG